MLCIPARKQSNIERATLKKCRLMSKNLTLIAFASKRWTAFSWISLILSFIRLAGSRIYWTAIDVANTYLLNSLRTTTSGGLTFSWNKSNNQRKKISTPVEKTKRLF